MTRPVLLPIHKKRVHMNIEFGSKVKETIERLDEVPVPPPAKADSDTLRLYIVSLYQRVNDLQRLVRQLAIEGEVNNAR